MYYKYVEYISTQNVDYLYLSFLIGFIYQKWFLGSMWITTT